MPRIAHAVSLGVALGLVALPSRAGEFTLATLSYQPAWCAPEMDPLGDDVCHVTGTPAPDGRRTLVIFLHGVIGKNTMWQWLQERGIGKAARELHFDAIVPQAPRVGPDGAGGFAWPGMGRAHESEEAMLASWQSARRALEAREGKPFDEVYVVGFSSGAYFATSLALRSKLAIDGYVVLAGGAPGAIGPSDAERPRVPVFIGVCARDTASAPEARELGDELRNHGWPVRVDEQAVGHGVSDVHVGHALTWFRARASRERAKLAAP
jgi:predicted esterase